MANNGNGNGGAKTGPPNTLRIPENVRRLKKNRRIQQPILKPVFKK